MTKMVPRAHVLAVNGGSRWTFGDFLDRRQRMSKKTVAAVARESGVSRANYYLLRDDKQLPSLSTAIALLSAIGFECAIPSDDEPEADVYLSDDHGTYHLVFDWSASDRSRAIERLWSSADIGLAALGGGALATGVAGVAGVVASPVLAPAAATALAVALLRRNRRRAASADEVTENDPPVDKETLLQDFTAAAEQMPAEDLEALLAAMKAMRNKAD